MSTTSNVDMITATSRIQLEATNVRLTKPNWKSYLQSQMILQEDFNFITAFEGTKSSTERTQLLEKNRNQCARTFSNLVTKIVKDQNVRYVLTLLDDFLQEDRFRVEIFFGYARKQKCSLWEPFLPMLNRLDGFIINQMSAILAKLACWGATPMDGADLNIYFDFLKRQLRNSGDEYVDTSARCLQMMLRFDEYRRAFLRIDGLTSIVSALNGKTNFQLQYQLIFCIWCMAFNPLLAECLHRHGVIQTLGDILSESSKEKVIRIILATFRNMIEKVEDAEIVHENSLQMVQSKVLKTLELMDSKKFDDPDLQNDIEFMTEKLQLSVADLSSFDEYCTELRSGRLQWSPVHKSEKFWHENATRFNEKNFELIKILVKILEAAQDPLILCVAAHDMGEYVRHYPRGKTVIETLQGKEAVMKLLTADDPNVRYHALLAIQKLMVHNWEYLGKQLDADHDHKDM